MSAIASSTPAVEIRGLRKQFGETRALDGLDLRVPSGRIVGVAGPNGAGKSTMVKILAGEIAADSGDVLVDGEPWTPTIGATQVAVVHQEPQLFPNFTVLDNLLVGRERDPVRRPAASPAERQLLEQFGIAEEGHRLLGNLPIGVQQRVEIVRALATNVRVLLFDEPNSALTEAESDELFKVMHRLADEGHAIILVSHRLRDLAAHAEAVAVVLDGRTSAILAGPELTEENLARAITVTGGRTAGARQQRTVGQTSLRLRGWTHAGGLFGAIDLTAATGEIVAIVGVEGSGAREMVRSIPGFEHAQGQMEILVESTDRDGSARSGYVPPDRRGALFFNFSVGENIVSRLDRLIRTPLRMRSRRQSAKVGAAWIGRMRVKTPGPAAWIGSLSGGNQQKVLIAAAMAPHPSVLVLEEPTRGVDIGSKREIYQYLRDYADAGAVVILYCTEIPEVFEVADRVHVMAGGRLSDARRVGDFADEKDLAAEVARLESAAVAQPGVQ